MTESAINLVRYYGLNDYATYFNLEKAMNLLEKFDYAKTSYTVIEILELYNATLFIDNGLFHKDRSAQDIKKLISLAKRAKKIIAVYFNSLTRENVGNIVNVPYIYISQLLDLLGIYKIYETIDAIHVLAMLDANNIDLSYLLANKKLVIAYDSELHQRMLGSPKNAELVIRKHLETRQRSGINLPKSITPSEYRNLIESYIKDENANPNFINLIATANVHNNTSIGLDPALKLLAKRTHQAWTDNFFADSKGGIETGCEIRISNDQAEPVVSEMDGLFAKISYSQKWLDDNQDFPTILSNFIYLFEFADRHMLLTMPSFTSDLGIVDRYMRTSGKEDYPRGAAFGFKEQCSALQVIAYDKYLKSKNIELEEIIEWFFNSYLVEEFGVTGFQFHSSTRGTSYLEKCRHIFPEMDSILRQFVLYCQNGEIDKELLSLTTDTVKYHNLPSLIDHKYAYFAEGTDIESAMCLLFSDQSGMTYIDDNLKANNLSDLVRLKRPMYNQFHDHQKGKLDYLIAHNVLIKQDGFIKFRSVAQFIALHNLWHCEALAFHHCSQAMKQEIIAMESKGWLIYENTLLTHAESSYFNFYLNQVEFGDGPDLRNTYLHGSQANSENGNEHFVAYISAIRLMISLLIKLNDEFCILTKDK